MLQLKGGQNLVQTLTVFVEASMLSTSDATRLTSLGQTSDQDDPGAPAAAVYESHSGDIVHFLIELLE